MNPESKSRVVYQNLDTTFVNLWALLRNLSQRGFIGRVRVELKDYTADVFLTGSSTPLVHEIDRAAGTDTLEEAALHRLVLRARETPGTISVFEGPDEAVAVETSVDAKADDDTQVQVQESRARDLLVHHEPEAPTSPAAPAMPSPDERTMTPPIESPPVRDDDLNPAHSLRIFDPAAPDTEPRDEIEWGAVVKASGELVGAVERAVNGAGADFASLLNSARLALADDYTFLDPMSGDFSYAKSAIELSGNVPAGAYAIGLSEALRRVVDGVATGDRARRVRERVALEMFSVARKRKEILSRSGFLTQLDRIAGTKVI
jgi:hypothetical protein